MQDWQIAIFVGLLGGLFAKGILVFVRTRERTAYNEVVFPVEKYVTNYAGIQDLVAGDTPPTRWLRYLLFRLGPLFIGFILAAGLFERAEVSTPVAKWWMLLAFLAPTLVGDTLKIASRNTFNRVRLIHIAIVVLIVTIFSLATYALHAIPYSELIPSLSSLREGLWIGLFTAVFVTGYFNATNMASQGAMFEGGAPTSSQDDIIMAHATRIRHSHGSTIESTASRYDIDVYLLLAILVYEDLNRPAPLRVAENLLVRLPGVALTVGIAQVRSERPLSDTASIEALGQLLHRYISETEVDSTDTLGKRHQVLQRVNGNLYAHNVEEVYQAINNSVELYGYSL